MIRNLLNKLFGKKGPLVAIDHTAEMRKRQQVAIPKPVVLNPIGQTRTIHAIIEPESTIQPLTPANRVQRNEVSNRPMARTVTHLGMEQRADDNFYTTTFHPLGQPSYSVPSRYEDDRRASSCSSNYSGSSSSDSGSSSCSAPGGD